MYGKLVQLIFKKENCFHSRRSLICSCKVLLACSPVFGPRSEFNLFRLEILGERGEGALHKHKQQVGDTQLRFQLTTLYSLLMDLNCAITWLAWFLFLAASRYEMHCVDGRAVLRRRHCMPVLSPAIRASTLLLHLIIITRILAVYIG